MFTLSTEHRYLLYSQPTDMRKSFDSLSGLIKNELTLSPHNGDVFLFINKNRDKVKLLHWTGGSFILYYKRLERGTFEFPGYDKKAGSIKLDYARMVMLIDGLSIKNIHQRKR
ncbi:MAG: IS66 family insertion sequence element accessory protein TnpB [Cyclobacteriaceae bacterium]